MDKNGFLTKEESDEYMKDCKGWKELCDFFDEEQHKIDEEFKKLIQADKADKKTEKSK